MQNTECLYFSHLRTLFEDIDLDIFIEGTIIINTFNKSFGINSKIKACEIIETKITLETYKVCFISQGTKKNHRNIEDFEISTLRLRTNRLPINNDLHRMRLRQNGNGLLYDSNDIENINLSMLECPVFGNSKSPLFSLKLPTPYSVML